jgi:hypothetical protein
VVLESNIGELIEAFYLCEGAVEVDDEVGERLD